MPTVIDSLVVALRIDDAQYQEGRKRASEQFDKTKKEADKTAKDVELAGKQAAKFFDELKRSALSFFAVLTAGRGMANFTRDVVSSGAQLDRLAKNLNTTASTLSAWGNAAELSGGSAGAFQGTISRLSEEITSLKMTGESSLSPFLQRFGIQVVDSHRKMLPLTSILLQMSDALKSVPDRADAFNIGKMMGLDEGTINLLLKGRGEIKSILADQAKGAAMTDAQARKAREAQEQWVKTRQQMEATGRELVIKLLPAMQKVADLLLKMAEVATPMLVQLVDLLTQLDQATDGWSSKLLVALGIFRLMGGPAVVGGLWKIASAITGIGSAATTAAGGSALGALMGRLAAVVKLGSVAALALHSDDLNAGENEFNRDRLAQIQALQAKRSSATPTAPSGTTRGLRNNNPGNLEYRGQAGATSDGRFARFATLQQGVTALASQLRRYGARGLNTIRSIVGTYAPKGENNVTAYIADLIQQTGFGADQRLNLNDQATLSAMMQGISHHEGNGFLNSGVINAGIAASAPQASARHSTTISIGRVEVNTQASDAKGIARDFRNELVAQANNGMN